MADLCERDPPYHVSLLEVPDQPCPALELLPTHLTVELRRVLLHTADIVVLHTIHCRALELTLLHTYTHTHTHV